MQNFEKSHIDVALVRRLIDSQFPQWAQLKVSPIEFGGLAVGDPACDLAIAWTMFNAESRKIFREILPLDDDTWTRGQAWTLWKSLITAAGFTNPNNIESEQCWRIIDDVLADFNAAVGH